ncbi:hypothetical protein PIROE2DRAFT_2028 [Piromyces sp. E2]|nr:hypothetical protein PIROE2DRAFT_2028 [Piromyces sp. E2]|eukprot:OUM69849.1 hypothetical protein PIROE2DRAFT_2028 [Piromyces sp. E2]
MEETYNTNNYPQNISKMGSTIYSDSQSKPNKKVSKRHSSYTPISIFNNVKDKVIQENENINSKNTKLLSSSTNFDKHTKRESFESGQYYEQSSHPSRSSISNENQIINSINDTKLNMRRKSARLSTSSFNNVMIENYVQGMKNHQIYDESGRNNKIINNLDEYHSKRDSQRLSLYSNKRNSINQSPIIMELSKDIKTKELSNRGSNSDISVHSQSRVGINKQGSSFSLNSNNIISNNIEDDMLLELSVNSLELLGSYLKNSYNENLNKSGLPLYEEKPLNYKHLSENNIGYYSKRNSSIVLPFLKLNEFIEDQDISETITSVSKTWPVEKSGFVLRKIVYSNGVYKNMNSFQDRNGKEISTQLGYKEIKNIGQSKKKGKHKKNQSHDNYILNGNINSYGNGYENKDWEWELFYVELRGQYLFFYRLYNADTCWKKEGHNKAKNKPGTLENIRNVFVERIISFGRNKKNSNHSHPTSPAENQETTNNIKVHKNGQQYQQTSQTTPPQDKTSTSKRKSLNALPNQTKPTLQQQLLASQNIHPREHHRKSSSISRSFTFANITTTNLNSICNNQMNLTDNNNNGKNSINLDKNSNSPSVQSPLPPHPTYSPSFSNRQYINSSSPKLSSPYPSPLNTNMLPSRKNSSSQLTPSSMNSTNGIDFAPIVVPSVPNTNYPRSNSYPQITNSITCHGSSPMVNNISNILPENEENTIKEDISDMNNILPPQMNLEEGSSIVSFPTSTDSPKEVNEVQSSLINTTTETIETKVISTNITSQVISDIVDSYQQSDEDEHSDHSKGELNKSSIIKTTTTVTTSKTTSSILSSVSIVPTLSHTENNQDTEEKVLPKRVSDSFSNVNQHNQMMEKTYDTNRTNDSFANVSQLNRMSMIDKSQDSNILSSTSRISDSFANISHISRQSTVNNSKIVVNRKIIIDSTKSIKDKRISKMHELSSQSIKQFSNDRHKTGSPYMDSPFDDQISTDMSLNIDQNHSFNQPINNISSNVSSNVNVIASREMPIPERRHSKTFFMSSIQSPSNSNNNSPSSSLPLSTPMVRVSNNNLRSGNKYLNNNKQKHHSTKITGKPILSLNDVNGPLDVLRAHRVLVHYIPLNYSIVEQLSYTEKINLKEGAIEKEIPLILLTYVNQDKVFSSACQVLLQMTNIGLGTVTNSQVSPTGLQKMESFNSDTYSPSSPLSNKRHSLRQNSPVLPSGQMPFNVSLSSTSIINNSMTLVESLEKETQLIENEANGWSCHIQQSSNIIENPNMNYSSLGYIRYDDISPEELWNEERQIVDPSSYSLKNMNTTIINDTSRNSRVLSSSILANSNINAVSVSANCNHQNETANTKQEINRSKSNRSFFSDIAPTFYEGNSTSFGLDSLVEDNNQSRNISITNSEEPIHIEEKPTIEIKRKHKEMNPTFMSHSLPYDYKVMEIMKSSPFISSPGTRSLDDGKIEPPTEEIEGGVATEKNTSYPIITDISEIKPSASLKLPFRNEISSSSSITTLISQESNKSKQSKLNAIYEESFSKEQIGSDRDLYSFEVVKSKDKELGEDSTSIILPKTPSMVCEVSI